MWRGPTALLAALVVAGCGPVLDSNAWFLSQYKNSADYLFEPEATPRQPDPRPDVKALIGANIASVFGRSNVRNVNVSAPHPHGYGWVACIRADVSGITNQDLGLQYFVVEIDNGEVGVRRVATPADKCEAETFEPV